MTIGTCADECTTRENCGAFVITGCTTTKNCGGQCTLYTNNTTNIIPKSAFGNGLCSTTPGDMKLYRIKKLRCANTFLQNRHESCTFLRLCVDC